ncbi:MAG: exodeoxyribonuclease III [Myxococcota bacterium]
MRIATFNVNSLRARLDHVKRYAEEAAPDVLCLQELKLDEGQIPYDELKAMGYPHIIARGQPSYNGVAMLSKHPIEDPQTQFHGFDDPAARVVAGTVQGIRIYGLYVPNGQAVGSEKFHYKLGWLEQLRIEVHNHADDISLVVCGDMNIAPTDLDVWDPFKLDGSLQTTADERQALDRVLAWGLKDAWRHLNPFEQQFTWWDYQKMGFVRNHGLRIDHIFLSDDLLGRLKKMTIHRDVRGWDTPSDHAPVSVDL